MVRAMRQARAIAMGHCQLPFANKSCMYVVIVRAIVHCPLYCFALLIGGSNIRQDIGLDWISQGQCSHCSLLVCVALLLHYFHLRADADYWSISEVIAATLYGLILICFAHCSAQKAKF